MRAVSLVFALLLFGCAATSTDQSGPAIAERGSAASAWQGAPGRAGWEPFVQIPATGEWFEVYRIRPHVFAIYEPGQFEEVVSYLIIGTERAVLFDTGLGIGDMHALVTKLTNRPISVINSHAHYDHIGGNHAFDDVAANVTAFTTARTAGAPNETVRDYVSETWLARELPGDVSADNYHIRAYPVPTAVADGARFDLGGVVLEAILTPGHTDDSLCLIDRSHRLLFTGDTFYPAPLYTHIDGAGLAAYQQSLARLAAIADEVELILPGHNEPVADVGVLARAAAAFDAIRAGRKPDAAADGLYEYDFDGFSVLVDPADLARE